MKVSEIKEFPALGYDDVGDLCIAYCRAFGSGDVATDYLLSNKWESTVPFKPNEDWRPFNPATDKLPEGCVLPDELKHLATPPKPVLRPFRSADEVPGNLVWARHKKRSCHLERLCEGRFKIDEVQDGGIRVAGQAVNFRYAAEWLELAGEDLVWAPCGTTSP